jgi:hypothetical protein
MKNETAFQIEIPFTISREMVESIIVGALEGGSNYWYLLGEGIPAKDEEQTPLSMRVVNALMEDPEFKLEILDLENEDEVLGYLTLEGLKNAFRLVAGQHAWHFTNLVSEHDDAETHDVFFQCAVMGEIVFG